MSLGVNIPASFYIFMLKFFHFSKYAYAFLPACRQL
jgi:hypothetical protein